MRGDERQQESMFSYVSLEQRVPAVHPLRAIRQMVDQALSELSVHFESLYARRGRPSKPPEQLIRALLVQLLYGIKRRADELGGQRNLPIAWQHVSGVCSYCRQIGTYGQRE